MRTILIIDDEQATLEMLGLFLEAYGYVVFTANTGEKGVSLFREKHPEIVMTDIKMPGMDGFEVLRALKTIEPGTEVIVFTGHGDMDLAIKALNLDATDFINKPIQKRYLEAALQRAEERLSRFRQSGCHARGQRQGELLILEIFGNVTAGSKAPLAEALQGVDTGGVQKLLLCLDANAVVNGAGIALLSQLLLESAEQGQAIAITGVTHTFARVFAMAGLTRVATILPDKESALDFLGIS